MTTRKEQAALAKGKLIQAAKDLVTQKGYDNVTITDITKACDMSVGNFYNYFKSKADIITVMERTPYNASIDQILRKGGTVSEMLRDYITVWNSLGDNSFGDDFAQQWFIYHINHPSPSTDPENKILITISEVSRILNLGIETGELKEDTCVDILARAIAHSIIGAELSHVMMRGDSDRASWGEQYCTTILPCILSPYYAKQNSLA